MFTSSPALSSHPIYHKLHCATVLFSYLTAKLESMSGGSDCRLSPFVFRSSVRRSFDSSVRLSVISWNEIEKRERERERERETSHAIVQYFLASCDSLAFHPVYERFTSKLLVWLLRFWIGLGITSHFLNL